MSSLLLVILELLVLLLKQILKGSNSNLKFLHLAIHVLDLLVFLAENGLLLIDLTEELLFLLLELPLQVFRCHHVLSQLVKLLLDLLPVYFFVFVNLDIVRINVDSLFADLLKTLYALYDQIAALLYFLIVIGLLISVLKYRVLTDH